MNALHAAKTSLAFLSILAFLIAFPASAHVDCVQCRSLCKASKDAGYTEEIAPAKSVVVTHHNNDAQALFEKARSLDPAFGGKSAMGAATIYKKAALLDPNNPQYRNYLAAALVRAGLYEEAVYNLKQAIAHAPSVAKYVVNLGYVYHRQGREVLALVQYMRGLALAPTNLRARLFTAHALETLGLKNEAKLEFQNVLNQDTSQVEATAALKRLRD